MHDIFISYSTKDQLQAETVRDILEKNGIPCWMAPRDIPGGSNYTKEIPSAIRGCQVFVLILSQNSQNSPWVLKELDSAVNCGKVILPFMLEEFQLRDEFNFLLTGAQRYAAYQKKAEALEALISRIRAITEGTEKEKPAPVQTEDPPVPEKAPEKNETFLGIAQCPACGGSELEQLKKISKITPAEKLWNLLIPVGAIVGALLMMLVSALIFAFAGMSSSSFSTILLLMMLAGLVGGGFLGSRMSRERIRRQRVRNHIHPYPMRCTACEKVFLIEEV